MSRFGVNAGLKRMTGPDLRALWRLVEELGFDVILHSDHFYPATLTDSPSLDSIATHAALAVSTERVTCNCLMYCVGYRHPAVLASAITAIDQLSGGRAAIGLGAGWQRSEYDAYGMAFPPLRDRMDQLEEAVQVVKGLLYDEETTFEGKWFRLDRARNDPRPVQARIPIWVGGPGDRTLHIAARHATGWNLTYHAVSDFSVLRAKLRRYSEEIGRDPTSIETSVTVGLAWDEDSLLDQYGPMAERVRPSVLGGSDQEVVDGVGAYLEAGAGELIVSTRGMRSGEPLERFAALMSKFR